MRSLKRGQFGYPSFRRRLRLCRAFTVVESLMAAGILLIIVVAVSSAVTVGQQNGYETQQRISATLAAEELMARLVRTPYDDLPDWDGHVEEVGAMTDTRGDLLPAGFRGIGRMVFVEEDVMLRPGTGLNIDGVIVTVQSVNNRDEVLAELRRFVPYPSTALPDAINELFADATESEEDGGVSLLETTSSSLQTTTGSLLQTTTNLLGSLERQVNGQKK